MKVSEHLAAMHKAAHGHHTRMIAAHEKVMEKIAGTEDEGAHHVSFHKSAIASHQQMADYHEGAMEECQKAAAAIDLAKSNMLVPDNVRGIITNFPGVTAVPRAGQRAIPEQTEVPPEFEKLLAIEDGQ